MQKMCSNFRLLIHVRAKLFPRGRGPILKHTFVIPTETEGSLGSARDDKKIEFKL